MSAAITNWNLDPNIKWYLRLSSGSVELYKTQADAEAQTNRVAYGSFENGTDVAVTLNNDTTEPDIEIFNDFLSWHLRVTYESETETFIWVIEPWTDLPEISDPLLATEASIQARALYEINVHTKTRIEREVSLAQHYTDLDIGDIVRITETMRGLNNVVQCTEVTTKGTAKSLTDNIRTVEYKDLVR